MFVGTGNAGSSKSQIDSPFRRCLIEGRDCLPRPNKSGRCSITTGGAGLEIDVAEDDGMIGGWVAEVDRSLVIICRTGLEVGVGVAIGLTLGMLVEVGFST